MRRAILVLAAVSGGCSGPPGQDVGLPVVDMAGYEPRARQLIEERLAAARARPHDGQALGMAAMALHAYQILEPAAQAYRHASGRAPSEYRWHYLLGVVASDLGRLEEAEEALRTAAGLAQRHLFVRLRLADCLLQAGDPEEALDLYDRAASEHPDSMAAHFGRGSALARLGRSEEALASLERAATFGDDYRPLHYRLALALRSAGRDDEAAHFMDLYERLDPAPRTPFPDPLLQEVDELRVGSYRHHLNRGIRFETAGNLEEALREYSLAMGAEAAPVHALVNLISVYGKLGRYEEADATYREAISRNSGIEEAHYNHAVTLSRRALHREAEAAYRQALAVNPYSADARLNLGDALEQQGRHAGAAEQFREVLQLSPGHRLGCFRLGMSLYRQNRRQDALIYLRRTVAVQDSETPQFLMVLARAERNAGNDAEAARRATEARRLAREYGLNEILAILDREFPSGR
ncbi:MAG: tetratricopeptide repeat protein [Bryobacterales bacterium]|nr:tetratricopeptide repeat protein [Bryobacterales bacterium]